MRRVPLILLGLALTVPAGACLGEGKPAGEASTIRVERSDATPARLESLLSDPANARLLAEGGLPTGHLLLDTNLIDPDMTVVRSGGREVAIYSGCRAHECDTKAYLAVDRRKRITAVATRGYNFCDSRSRAPCSSTRPILHLATVEADPKMLGLIVEHLVAACRSGRQGSQGCIVYTLHFTGTASPR